MKGYWSVFVVDAFAREIYGGNQAGVVLLEDGEDFPEETLMRKIAGELKHSETAFVKRAARDVFQIRYFTPVEEVELCGHATVGAFWVLLQKGVIECGEYRLMTGNGRLAGESLTVLVSESGIWMDMAAPKDYYTFTAEEAVELYEAYGLKGEAERMDAAGRSSGNGADCRDSVGKRASAVWLPRIVNTGLSDIILPVAGRKALCRAVQDTVRVEELSRRYQVVGVHMFCLSDQFGILAECRNFAPLYGIPEESATGTANGALTWYLYGCGHVIPGKENVFLQGEPMGKPSLVRSRLELKKGSESAWTVKIGGTAVISLEGRLGVE